MSEEGIPVRVTSVRPSEDGEWVEVEGEVDLPEGFKHYGLPSFGLKADEVSNGNRCEHLEPKKEWPYVAGRCKNNAEDGSDYCSEHRQDDE